MKIFLKILAVFILSLTVAICTFFIWLKTENAKIVINQAIVDVLKSNFDLTAKIDNLNISLPIIADIGSFSVHDSEGEICSLKDLHINLLPSLFSLWEITFWSISAEELKLMRIPQIKSISSGNYSGFLNPDVIVREISFNKVILFPEVTGFSNLALSSSSYLQYNSSKQQLIFTTQGSLLTKGEKFFEIFGSYDGQKEQLDIKAINFNSEITKVSGKLFIDQKNNIIDGEINHQSNFIDQLLTEYWDNAHTNSLEETGEIRIIGTVKNPEIIAKGSINFESLPLTYTTQFLLSENGIEGKLQLEHGTIKAHGDIEYKNDKLSLSNFIANGDGFEKTANLALSTKSMILTGKVSVIDKTLAETIKYFRLPFIHSGAMNMQVVFSSKDNIKQQISLMGQVNGLSSNVLDFDTANIDLNSTDLWQGKFPSLTLLFKSLKISNQLLDEVKISAEPKNNDISVKGSVIAKQPVPIKLSFDSLIDFFPNSTSADNCVVAPVLESSRTLSTLRLCAPCAPSTCLPEANLERSLIKSASEQNINIAIGKITGTIGFNPIKDSVIDGAINLTGSMSHPVVQANLLISEILVPNSRDKFKLTLNSNLTNEQFDCSGNIVNQGSKKLVTFNALIKNKFSLSPFEYVLVDDKSFTADLKISDELDLLSFLTNQSEHKITGKVVGNVKAYGDLSDPIFSGELKLKNAQYEYKNYGVKIKDISSNIKAKGKLISFSNILAKDNFGNILRGDGRLSLNDRYDFSFNAASSKFNPINTPYMYGEVSGSISIVGNSTEAIAKGQLSLGPFEIKIPEHFIQDIPELNIKEVVDKTNSSQNISDYKLKLDIALGTTDKVFVRGMGVNTRLKGNLKISGSSDTPNIKGILNSVKGRYQEFGKVLTIKQGELIFDGPLSPSPFLNIVGVYISGSNEIRLILSGSILNPEISIESTPSMSEERALSILLFGTNLEDISAFQALQLADGLRRLSGHGGGFDPLGMGRKILGVDDINFKTDSKDPEKTSVGIGKYLTDKIYLEVERGVQANNNKLRIEVQVTPKISIENITKQEGNTSLGVNWRFDY